jgi:hypothetical protein
VNAKVQTFSGVYWPVPPFFKFATPLPPEAGMECDLQLVKGRVLHEDLVDFAAGIDTVGVRRPQPHGIKRIDLAEVRSIKMKRPVKYIADATALLAIGATERRQENQKPFVVWLVDGSKVTGTTLGFVQDEAGLFLFLVETDAAHVINCFIPAAQMPQGYSNALVSRIKVMAELDISEHRRPQDGKIDFGRHGPLSIELRVAIIPTANNLEDVVLRILGGAEPLPLDQVGFSARDLGKLKQMISRSYGLILVCGPTGSGKTTTLHSVLRELNRLDIKIWTAEDPIEITQPGLRQVQVNSKIDWTFAAAMCAFLRADPDVIMVGEMRDAETTKIGIEASLIGHLVFSTLHTNSAAESIVRLLDLGMDPFNFADALIGILSQRLARKLCLNCRQVHVASAAGIAVLCDEYCRRATLYAAPKHGCRVPRAPAARRQSRFWFGRLAAANGPRAGHRAARQLFAQKAATKEVSLGFFAPVWSREGIRSARGTRLAWRRLKVAACGRVRRWLLLRALSMQFFRGGRVMQQRYSAARLRSAMREKEL